MRYGAGSVFSVIGNLVETVLIANRDICNGRETRLTAEC